MTCFDHFLDFIKCDRFKAYLLLLHQVYRHTQHLGENTSYTNPYYHHGLCYFWFYSEKHNGET